MSALRPPLACPYIDAHPDDIITHRLHREIACLARALGEIGLSSSLAPHQTEALRDAKGTVCSLLELSLLVDELEARLMDAEGPNKEDEATPPAPTPIASGLKKTSKLRAAATNGRAR